MFLEYSKNETRQKENLETIFNGLKRGGLRLLAYHQPIRTDRDFAFAAWIDYQSAGGLFVWRHYGQCANKATKTALKWLLETIFDDCKYFAFVDAETYSDRACAYYDAEREKRAQELQRA